MDIEAILKLVNEVSDSIPSAADVPAPLRMGARMRKGMSATMTSARIISRLSDAGFKVDNFDTESQNMLNQLVMIIVEEIFREIIMNSKIEITGAPGTLTIKAAGGNAGGPVIVDGASTNYPDMTGFVR